jgi:hypothetical protein
MLTVVFHKKYEAASQEWKGLYSAMRKDVHGDIGMYAYIPRGDIKWRLHTLLSTLTVTRRMASAYSDRSSKK